MYLFGARGLLLLRGCFEVEALCVSIRTATAQCLTDAFSSHVSQDG